MSSKSSIESNEGVSDTSLEYEVFLSFRGPDTRDKFTDHLYVRLNDAGIRVYRDDEELRIGEQIEPELLKGIKQSKIAIPIFSKGYAASKWCLKELTLIAECKRTTGMKVMPIFYDVKPSEVRNQTGNYSKAFQSHQERYDEEIIANWKRALREIGELKGWEIQSDARRLEGALVKEITNAILHELKKADLVVTNHLVGLEHHVKEVLKTLNAETDDVKIVAIHGMGGIGKTTLGKVIYNHLLPRFESHCFLADIRETVQSSGMKSLQERLISDILNAKSMNFSNVDERTRFIHEKGRNKRVLLLLDDIDDISHLKPLIERRDQFGYGSRIIITTRNKGIFDRFEVDQSYELTGLDFDHALELFNKHAFQNEKPPEEHVPLSKRIVEIAGGLPLALEVFGSLLRGKSKDTWVSTLKILEKVPHKDVSKKLRVSFEALEEQQRQMFLDIACFFSGHDINIVIHFWGKSVFSETAIEVLQQMSLIKIKEDHSLWMHDQLRDLGREIVRQEHEEPQRRSRLWNEEEAAIVLTEKGGSDKVRGININFKEETQYSVLNEGFARLPILRLFGANGSSYKRQKRIELGGKEYFVSNEDFARLPNLRLFCANGLSYKRQKRIKLGNLFVKSPCIFSELRWLSWHGFPHKYDTSNFSVKNLVMLDLSYSRIKSSWGGWSRMKMAKNLKVLNLTGCGKLVRTPNFSTLLKLERLILRECSELVEIDQSISMLKHLVIIDLTDCHRLCKLPKVLSCTDSLEEFIIDGTSVEEIPNWAPMRRLRVFSCSQSEFPIRPFAHKPKKFVGKLKAIDTLLESLKDSASLIELDLSWTDITELPDTIGRFTNLKVLKFDSTPIRELPAAIGMLENLITLDALSYFPQQNIPKLPRSLISLNVNCKDIQNADLSNLINLKNLSIYTSWSRQRREDAFKIEDPTPWWIGGLTNLESLILAMEEIISLHVDLGKLSRLTTLALSHCENLESIPMLPAGLNCLIISYCTSLGSLLNLPPSLKDLSITGCASLGSLLDLPPGLKNLDIGYCPLLGSLLDLPSGLKYLHIRDCASLGSLLDLPPDLKKLSICDCPSLGSLLDLPLGLEDLHIASRASLGLLSVLPLGLKKLHIDRCPSLGSLLDLPPSLAFLHISDCKPLTLRDLSHCDSLQELRIFRCDLSEVDGLEILENLKRLSIGRCENLQRLPDLSNLKKLRTLSVLDCPNLVEIPGTLESLDEFSIYDCKSLDRIPNIPNSKTMRYFHVENCGEIKRGNISLLTRDAYTNAE